MKAVLWSNRARKQMGKIPKQYQDPIFKCVDGLVEFPNCTGLDIKALKHQKSRYRMRVGRYSVFFDDREQVCIIAVQEVRKRDNRTYG